MPMTPSGLSDTAILNGWVNNARDTASQTLAGVADAGDTVLIYDGATQIGSAIVDGAGGWAFTFGRLLDGTHKLTAVAQDAGGHLSAASDALVFKVDTRPPSKPGGLVDASISHGLVNAAHNTVDQMLTGKTDASAHVAIYDGASQIGSVTAGATGVWSFTLGQLSEGVHKLSATASDTAGNVSAPSDVVSLTVDTHAPGAPGSLADSEIVAGQVDPAHNVANQALTGRAEAYSFVSVYDGATKLGSVQASGTGAWSFTLGVLADGGHSLTAAATDKAGNVSPTSAALAFVVDSHAPSAFLDGDITLAGTAVAPSETVTVAVDPGPALLVGDVHTLAGSAGGGNDLVTLYLSSETKLIGDALSIVDHARGGNDKLFGLGIPEATVIGDASTMSGDAQGGADTITASGLSVPLAIGDAESMTDYARGGDDNVFAGPRGHSGDGTAYGDALTMTGHAVGGDDTVWGIFSYGDAQSLADDAKGGDDVVNGVFELGRTGADFLYGDGGVMSGHTQGGDDTVTGRTSYGDAQTLTDDAKGGDDLVQGIFAGTNQLYGDGELLSGHAQGGDDTLLGSDASDVMWGDAAGVASTAKTGRDLFLFKELGNRHDIMDFELAKDRIEFDGLGLSSFADLSSHFAATTDGVQINLGEPDGAHGLFVIHGVTIAQLNAGNFVFN
jgi:hypothetical protein